MRLSIAEHKIHFPKINAPVQVTGSFGVATMSPKVPQSFVEFINTADRGVYMAKADGRNCVRMVAS